MLKRRHKNKIIDNLWEAYDRIEGKHSNIPDCCVEGFISGRTYITVHASLSEKDQKKLEKWTYVPCEKCLKNNKKNKLKINGTSLQGQLLRTIINSLDKKGDFR